MGRISFFKRAIYVITGILLFILSIQILGNATMMLLPLLKKYLRFIKTPHKALGFGWFGAYLMLSGSPIAALALSFFHGGLMNETATFFMIIGSRLGASLILIFIGMVESLRGRGALMDSLSVAFLSFLITLTINFPSLLVGYTLIQHSPLRFTPRLPFLGAVTNLYEPIVNLPLGFFSPIFFLPLGLIVVWISLSVFERAFRQIEIKEAKSSWINFMMEKPFFSFLLGSLITFAGQSISLSLGIMIPLFLKGYIQRRNLVPYIMGANIVTFIDTVFAAFLLQNPFAVNIAITAMLSNLLISLLFLLFYQKYYTFIEKSMNFLLSHRSAIVAFVIFLFVLPGLLVFF